MLSFGLLVFAVAGSFKMRGKGSAHSPGGREKEMQPLGLASGVAGESFLKAVFAVPVPGAVGFCEVAPRATTSTSVCTVCYNSVNQSKPI